MEIVDIILCALGLSMDATAVSLTDGMNEPKMKINKMLIIAAFFGVFQGVMPLIGYYAGSLFAEAVASIAPIVALVLLGFIGGRMIFESVKKKNGNEELPVSLGIKGIAVQAVATSIDALAVGISLLALDRAGSLALNIFITVGIIAATTFVLSLVALVLGKKFGKILSNKAELIGGIILVVIGLKIFIEGMFFG